MLWTVDRIENGYAIMESDSGEQFAVPVAALGCAKERDVFSVQPAPVERQRRLEEARRRQQSLFFADDSGKSP